MSENHHSSGGEQDYVAWRVLSRPRSHIAERSSKLPGDRMIYGFIVALGLVSFVVFSTVALYPLLKFGVAVLIVLPLCFLIGSAIRRIPLANRML